MKTTYNVPQTEWIRSTKEKLDSLDTALVRAEARLTNFAADVDEEVRSSAVAARVKLDDWRSRLSEARATASDVWDTVGGEIATAWEASRSALESGIRDIEQSLEGHTPDALRPSKGDTVFVHYRGRLDDGTEFQSTRGRDPIEFVLGEAHVIPGVEKTVQDMTLGEERAVEVPVDDAFGPRDESLVFTVEREAFDVDEMPKLGDRATIHPENEKPLLVTVRRIRGDTVEVDANHPLAGKALHMELKLVGIA